MIWKIQTYHNLWIHKPPIAIHPHPPPPPPVFCTFPDRISTNSSMQKQS